MASSRTYRAVKFPNDRLITVCLMGAGFRPKGAAQDAKGAAQVAQGASAARAPHAP